MSDIVRPFTVAVAPGVIVAARLAEDGGRESIADGQIRGIVLAVEDQVDGDGDIRRSFKVLDYRTSKTRGPVIRWLAESELAREEVGLPGDAGLRRMRRTLHAWIGGRLTSPSGKKDQNPLRDSAEDEAEAAIRVLLGVEAGQ